MYYERLTDENFLIYCAKHYDGRQCHTTEEFLEDIKRIKYIKKLVTRYVDVGELKHRLILNHLTILCNVFGPTHLVRILYLKMRDQFVYVKPFLVLLNVMPSHIYNVRADGVVDTDTIPLDDKIVQELRTVANDRSSGF